MNKAILCEYYFKIKKMRNFVQKRVFIFLLKLKLIFIKIKMFFIKIVDLFFNNKRKKMIFLSIVLLVRIACIIAG